MSNLFKISNRFLNTAARSPDFFVGEQVKLRTTVKQFPLTGLKVALCNDSIEAKYFADTLANYGADVETCNWKIDMNTPENVLKNVLKKMDIVIDSKLARELKFKDDEDLLKWNTKLIFIKLTDNRKEFKSKEDQDLKHLSDVNRILLALYDREHTGVGQVVEV